MMRIVIALCLITAGAAESKPAPSPSRSPAAAAGRSEDASKPKASPHAAAKAADLVSLIDDSFDQAPTPQPSRSEDHAARGRASASTSPAPAPAPVPRGMPWQTEAGIAVASVAGAAVVAGGIAAAVESQKSGKSGLFSEDDAAKSDRTWSAKSHQGAFRSSSQQARASKEDGRQHDLPVAAEVPGGPVEGQVTSAPASAAVQLFDDSKQQHAGALTSQVMFISVAGLLLFMACVFLAVSGITYYQKKRATRTVSETERMCEDEEWSEEDEEEYDEELLA